ncbi:MAG: hypothetical protein ACLPYS_15200 [Vulcanimicrobiaceae bacterium]
MLPATTGGGLFDPLDVVVDAGGKLCLANYPIATVSVFDTAHGNAALQAITGGWLNDPVAMAVH